MSLNENRQNEIIEEEMYRQSIKDKLDEVDYLRKKLKCADYEYRYPQDYSDIDDLLNVLRLWDKDVRRKDEGERYLRNNETKTQIKIFIFLAILAIISASIFGFDVIFGNP